MPTDLTLEEKEIVELLYNTALRIGEIALNWNTLEEALDLKS